MVLLLEEGVSPEKIAAVQKKAGYPVDGITLMDQVGMDVANNVFKFMSANLPERMAGPTSGLLQDLVDAGLLGNKAGKGFYSYVKGKRQGSQVTPEATAILQKHVRSGAPGAELGDEEVLERLYLPFINEMMFNVQDGFRSSVHGVACRITGMGWPWLSPMSAGSGTIGCVGLADQALNR